jgi:hypothetical protein
LLTALSLGISLVTVAGPPPRLVAIHIPPGGSVAPTPAPVQTRGLGAGRRPSATTAPSHLTGLTLDPQAPPERPEVTPTIRPPVAIRGFGTSGAAGSDGTIAVLRGVGNTWAIVQGTAHGIGAPTWAGVGDFDANGYDDLAWYHASNRTIAVFYGTPQGWSLKQATAQGIDPPTWAGVGDFNADRRDDIAWAKPDGDIAIFYGASGGWSLVQGTAHGIGAPTWAGVGDFDANGYDDLAWYHASNRTIAVFYGTPQGWSLKQATAQGIDPPTWAGVGDFNADRRDDIAWHQ